MCLLLLGLLVQDCELKESDYDYLRCKPARSALGPAVADNWLKGLSKIRNAGKNPRETQPLAVIKPGIDLIGWFGLARPSSSILERFAHATLHDRRVRLLSRVTVIQKDTLRVLTHSGQNYPQRWLGGQVLGRHLWCQVLAWHSCHATTACDTKVIACICSW